MRRASAALSPWIRACQTLRRVGFAIGLLALVPASAFPQASDPRQVQPERPSVATHAGTVAPGWIELEIGASFARAGGDWRGAAVPIAAKVGLAARWQLTIGGSIEAPDDGETGVGDLNVAVKYRFAESRVLGRLAIMPNVKLPTGSQDRGTGVDTTDGSLVLISSHSFGRVTLDLNAAYTRRSGDGTIAARNATVWAISVGNPAMKRIGWGTEISGTLRTTGPSGEPASYALLTGPAFSIARWLSVDAGVSVQLNEDHPYRIFFGGVWNVGKIWP